jgi:hypothetical protein
MGRRGEEGRHQGAVTTSPRDNWTLGPCTSGNIRNGGAWYKYDLKAAVPKMAVQCIVPGDCRT